MLPAIPPPLDLLLLAKKGSLIVSRPAFSFHIADPADAAQACAELFDLVASGAIKVEIGASIRSRTPPKRIAISKPDA